MKKQKVKISKKLLKEKYPTKIGVDEDSFQCAKRVCLVFALFLIVALSVDVYHFTHWILTFVREGEKDCSARQESPWPETVRCVETPELIPGNEAYAAEKP